VTEPPVPLPAGQGKEPRSDDGRPAGRAPGWREVLLLAAALLAIVFAVELVSLAVPAVRDAFAGSPLTALVLVAGTAAVLGLGLARRPRR
jgi:hypothetical protein